MRVLITGTAGFIGFHLARRLIDAGHFVAGIDGMTPYYDVRLKEARAGLLARSNGYRGHVAMLERAEAWTPFADAAEPDIVIHLAAQAGVRYSIENPRAYIDANLVGTFNVLEYVRTIRPRHFLLASTSSVYGTNTAMPFREVDRTDHPMTLYAATKKATEVMAHAYAHLWNVPTTAFRFFTVYGPWGRPDMALFRFAKAILEDRPIEVYGEGRMSRDFTYVGDLVEAIARLVERPPVPGAPATDDPALDSIAPGAPFRVVNIGGGQPVGLMDYIATLERHLGRTATKTMLPMQQGDVPATTASPALLESLTGFRPTTTVEEGIAAFVAWYRSYHDA
jgi:UDP-glucuronate 4-epimerase